MINKKPQLSFRLDKHHVRDFHVLADSKDILFIKAGGAGKKIKHVGPAVIEIEQRGIKQKITKHSLKSKKFWDAIGAYTRIGIWATNTRLVAPFLPNEFLPTSKRFRGMNENQRARLKKIANKAARGRNRRG